MPKTRLIVTCLREQRRMARPTYLFAVRICETKLFADLTTASMTACAWAAGEPPAIPPSCRSGTCTETRPFRYGNVTSACVTSDVSYRDTHVPSGSLL